MILKESIQFRKVPKGYKSKTTRTQNGGLIWIRTQTIRFKNCDRETLHGKLVKWEGGRIRREQMKGWHRKRGAYLSKNKRTAALTLI